MSQAGGEGAPGGPDLHPRFITTLTGDGSEFRLIVVQATSGTPCVIDEVEQGMNKVLTTDAAAAAVRHARYGTLPDRIRFEDMTETMEAVPGGGVKAAYDPEGSWKYYSCLALDLGL